MVTVWHHNAVTCPMAATTVMRSFVWKIWSLWILHVRE
ncbi:hypothetical protein U9M48_043540 [Paspalum notatum var. saurae]|uniref:Uncharacterized protein n=1 Tax=Paspalum notatum var. saurae TaxID=547442 RepID=A0AAQ3UXN2_PASNO